MCTCAFPFSRVYVCFLFFRSSSLVYQYPVCLFMLQRGTTTTKTTIINRIKETRTTSAVHKRLLRISAHRDTQRCSCLCNKITPVVLLVLYCTSKAVTLRESLVIHPQVFQYFDHGQRGAGQDTLLRLRFVNISIYNVPTDKYQKEGGRRYY